MLSALQWRDLRSLCFRKGLLRLPCQSLGTGLYTPSLAHSILTNEEVLCPTIPHTVVTRPGARDHRATCQSGAGWMPVGLSPRRLVSGRRGGGGGREGAWGRGLL